MDNFKSFRKNGKLIDLNLIIDRRKFYWSVKEIFMFIQIIVAVIFLLFILIKLLENSHKIQNQSGNTIPMVEGIFSSFFLLFTNSNEHHGFKAARFHKKHGNIIMYYPQMKPVVSVASPELARVVLTDSKTFPKQSFTISLNREFEKIINPKNVFLLNGEDWKRHRQSINPGFYDLSIYTEKIIDKTDISMEVIKKETNIPDIHEILQKMTLYFKAIQILIFS